MTGMATVSKSSQLALLGGESLRTKGWPSWPIFDKREEAAMLRVIRSGHWGRLNGSEVSEFEKEFSHYHDCAHGIAVVNGSAALRLALIALGLQAGDEVIVPPYTFIASASSIVEANAVPVFVDIHPDSLCLDPARIEAAITQRTRAILVVHLGGRAADMEAILRIARRHGLSVIEDAAHAHGGEYLGRKLGSFGDIGCFSFQASKNLNAGEGGIIVTNDEALAASCHALSNCGRVPGHSRHGHEIFGGNYRLTELQGALLRAQMARFDEQTCRRDGNGRYLDERLASLPGVKPLPPHPGQSRHARHLYCFRFDTDAWDGIPRETFLRAIQAEGLPISPGYTTPLYEQPTFAEKRFGPYSGANAYQSDIHLHVAACPVTERISRREGCWLTQNVMLGSREDMDDILAILEKVWAHRTNLPQEAPQ